MVADASAVRPCATYREVGDCALFDKFTFALTVWVEVLLLVPRGEVSWKSLDLSRLWISAATLSIWWLLPDANLTGQLESVSVELWAAVLRWAGVIVRPSRRWISAATSWIWVSEPVAERLRRIEDGGLERFPFVLLEAEDCSGKWSGSCSRFLLSLGLLSNAEAKAAAVSIALLQTRRGIPVLTAAVTTWASSPSW